MFMYKEALASGQKLIIKRFSPYISLEKLLSVIDRDKIIKNYVNLTPYCKIIM